MILKVAAIISEYNPFHNGHKYQIDKAREITGADKVIALMSGNFVQRGEFAAYSEPVRTSAAISCGVDLVLENPAIFTLRSAEGYASSAVYRLSAINCVDYLVFGAEHPYLNDITEIAELLAKEPYEYKSALSDALSSGKSFASARSVAVSGILGDKASKILKQPNNLLAIEYIKAIIKQNSPIKPILINRIGNLHDSEIPNGAFASASYIRQNIAECKKYVPKSAYEIYKNEKPFVQTSFDASIISALTLISKEQLKNISGISEGLENKIKTEALKCNSLDSLISRIKSKRYTYSGIKRSLLCAYLNITKDDEQRIPEYVKILGFNENGRKILNRAKKISSIPIIKTASPILKNESAMEIYKREVEYSRIYEIFHNI